jgi:hypothetical protein
MADRNVGIRPASGTKTGQIRGENGGGEGEKEHRLTGSSRACSERPGMTVFAGFRRCPGRKKRLRWSL